MDTAGPLQCSKCDRIIRVDFRMRDGNVEYYCKCTRTSIDDFNLDLVDGGPDAIDGLDHWRVW